MSGGIKLLFLVLGLLALIIGPARPEDSKRSAIALSTSQPGARVALVIGNSDYRHVRALPNPGHDAADIAAALRRLGFEVTLASDLDFTAMRVALRNFGHAARRAEIALFYFAGHGIEIDKINYLIPVDAQLAAEIDVEYEAIPLDLVMAAVTNSGGIRLVILDACRDNPFAAKMRTQGGKRSIGRGLAAVEPATGTIVGYAAREGTTASDGAARNSPYTAALLANLEERGLDIQLMFRKVRDHVLELTAGLQEPFTYGSLPGQEIYLNPPAAGSGKHQVPFADPELARDVALWNAVKESGNRPAIESYLERFPDGTFAELARARLAAIETAPPSLEGQNLPVDRNLVVRLQQELARVGCDPGPADGVWGGRTRRAAETFLKSSRLALAADEPGAAMLDALGRSSSRVCPLVCSPRQRIVGETCIEKTCPAGMRLDSGGSCIRATKQVVKTTKPASNGGVRSAEPAAKNVATAVQPTAKAKTCRTETRNECRIRARAEGAASGSGACKGRNRRQICS